jgi:hypothetical protein
MNEKSNENLFIALLIFLLAVWIDLGDELQGKSPTSKFVTDLHSFDSAAINSD